MPLPVRLETFLCYINSQKYSKQYGLTNAVRQPSQWIWATHTHRPHTKLTHEASGLVCPCHKHAPIFWFTGLENVEGSSWLTCLKVIWGQGDGRTRRRPGCLLLSIRQRARLELLPATPARCLHWTRLRLLPTLKQEDMQLLEWCLEEWG